jgi:hypothetical protein
LPAAIVVTIFHIIRVLFLSRDNGGSGYVVKSPDPALSEDSSGPKGHSESAIADGTICF